MKNRKLLIAACLFAGLSLAGNAMLLWQRNRPQAPAKAASKPEDSGVVFDAKAGPVAPGGSRFDFSGTAFEDDSWKLEDKKPEASVKLDTEFKWKEAGLRPAESEEKPPEKIRP